jgi:hypothetical protein
MKKKDASLYVLNRRLPFGDITNEEYQTRGEILVIIKTCIEDGLCLLFNVDK